MIPWKSRLTINTKRYLKALQALVLKVTYSLQLKTCEVLKICSYLQGYSWKNRLRFVRIYFDTPTFDIITKDRAAKFVNMLSAIGGTMGLLTGFSIISGIEILYFSVKIIWNLLEKKK